MNSSAKAWLAGLAAWFVPGAGHFVLGRWARGLALGGVVLLMCAAGALLRGQFNDITDNSNGLLPRAFGLFNLGTGAIYLWSLASGQLLSDPRTPEAARFVTFEYGNTFLMVAGLLNYLNALDAFDIAVGRKR